MEKGTLALGVSEGWDLAGGTHCPPLGPGGPLNPLSPAPTMSLMAWEGLALLLAVALSLFLCTMSFSSRLPGILMTDSVLAWTNLWMFSATDSMEMLAGQSFLFRGCFTWIFRVPEIRSLPP